MQTNIIYNEDCIIGMKNRLDDNSIDLIISSPPYNIGIDYSNYKDNLPWEEYKNWSVDWLSECYRVLKPDGRIAINILVEINGKENGGRLFFSSEFWQLMKDVGFNWAGYVRLEEKQAQRVKYTAWGSWMSASMPYLYCAEECVILAYKQEWKKQNNGISTIEKRDFIKNVAGIWKYEAEKKGLTKANFSLDIPITAINMLSYKNDIIFDPFMGSATTALACLKTDRQYIGFEISPSYCKIGEERLKNYNNIINARNKMSEIIS